MAPELSEEKFLRKECYKLVVKSGEFSDGTYEYVREYFFDKENLELLAENNPEIGRTVYITVIQGVVKNKDVDFDKLVEEKSNWQVANKSVYS